MLSSGPITYQEMQAWSNMMNRSLLVWEVELLRSLDRMYWRIMSDG
ncbi:hypothetical protein [Vibrio phage VpKK5]|nr:hypothetical protein VC55_gp47 [Vibrio phage VpKK5]AIM40609.2 hypothetical protein [Vibrio phage VpKK5]